MDISSIEVADTFDVELIHPKTGDVVRGASVPVLDATGAPVLDEKGQPRTSPGPVCTVTVYGPGSAQFAAAKAKNNLRFVERLKRKGKQEADPDEELANTARFLASCTVSFNNFDYRGMPNEAAAFQACYADRKMGWLTDLVNGEMGDWANFTTGSSKTS